MQVLVLAAGYATRLYPLTLNQPKPLLEVAGRPMLEHVVEKVGTIPGVDEWLIVTNQKFAGHFERWSDEYRKKFPEFRCQVFNDGSTSDADKLGAIGDINFVISQGAVKGDLIVIAGDNLFSESLEDFGHHCQKVKGPVLGVYDIGSLEEIKKYSSIVTDDQGTIVSFEEKPQDPKSTLLGIALYYYPTAVVELLQTYIKEGNNPDQPGRFVQWLYPRLPVHTWKVPGIWYDIGSKETLEEANRIFKDR
ncbi:MAG: nucleotidyltransferase family protein [Verrucomicrobiota bacterium]